MEAVVLVVHLMLALALIGIILIQQSEGGGLGIGGGGGMGGLATARGTANLLTRVTTILAICFFTTTLTLALIAKSKSAEDSKSILELAKDPEIHVPLAREGIDDVGAPDAEVLKDADTAADAEVLEAEEGETAPVVPISE